MANPPRHGHPIVPPPLNVELHPACSPPLKRGRLGPSKVGKKELEAMVKKGKIPSMDVVRHSEGEDHPHPRDDEVVVFDLYFDLGLGIPSVPLLEGILQLFHVELPHLSPSAILRLAVYEWAMRAGSAEGLAEHFAALHRAFCQPRFIRNEKKKKLSVVHFGCINFQLRGKGLGSNEYELEFPAWASNNRWPLGWVNHWFYYNVGKGSSLHSRNRDIAYVKEPEPEVVVQEDARTLLRKVTTKMGMRDLVEEYTMLKVCPLARGWSQIHKFERGEEQQLGLYKGHAGIDSAPDVLSVEDAIKKVEHLLGKPSLQECKAREARTGKWERKNRVCQFFGFQIPEAVDIKKLEELELEELESAEKEEPRKKKKGRSKKRDLGGHGDSVGGHAEEGNNKRRRKGKGEDNEGSHEEEEEEDEENSEPSICNFHELSPLSKEREASPIVTIVQKVKVEDFDISPAVASPEKVQNVWEMLQYDPTLRIQVLRQWELKSKLKAALKAREEACRTACKSLVDAEFKERELKVAREKAQKAEEDKQRLEADLKVAAESKERELKLAWEKAEKAEEDKQRLEADLKVAAESKERELKVAWEKAEKAEEDKHRLEAELKVAAESKERELKVAREKAEKAEEDKHRLEADLKLAAESKERELKVAREKEEKAVEDKQRLEAELTEAREARGKLEQQLEEARKENKKFKLVVKNFLE